MPTIKLDTKGAMQFKELDKEGWKKTLRRVLINGEPLSGKTTSLLTFPAPRHILIAPGEMGQSSIAEDDETKIYHFETDAGGLNYKAVWNGVQKLTHDILSGVYGPVETFAVDGLHKLYYLIMKAHGYTQDSDSKEYARYHEVFANYITNVVSSSIPYVVATCYDGTEAVEQGSKVMALFPDLPGKMAKQVMGMFPVVIHSKRTGIEKEQFFWELRSTGSMRGVGVHVPVRVKTALPPFCAPDWKVFEGLILGSVEPIIKQLTVKQQD